MKSESRVDVHFILIIFWYYLCHVLYLSLLKMIRKNDQKISNAILYKQKNLNTERKT